MAPQYEVLKPFQGATRRYEPGDQVEAAGWRNLRVLLSERYLQPVIPPSAPEFRPVPGGRRREEART